MIGYRSIQHQGYVGARTHRGQTDEEHNPYPRGRSAFYEYQDGCNAFRAGKVIDRQGHVAENAPNARRPNETNFKHGASW